MLARSRYLLSMLVLLAIVTSALGAGTVSRTAPESVGLSSERLERITEQVNGLVRKGRIAGVVTLVARKGQVAHFEASGWQDREARIPMRRDTIFRIASMTKPITSVAVMMLYEEGRFRLTDPVSRFIPEFANVQVLGPSPRGKNKDKAITLVKPNREITIHDLLTHTSGLTYQWDSRVGPMYNEAGITHGLIEDPGRIGDNVKKLTGIPLVHQPGAKFTYGLSTDVLGYLVEVVSGMTLEGFFKERIFEPLEMTNTRFFLVEKDVPRLATVYAMGPKLVRETRETITEGTMTYSTTYPAAGERSYYSGGGGLCSTVGDYYRFCEMLRTNGRSRWGRILSRKTVEMMTSVHVKTGESEREPGFGLGFSVQRPPGQSLEIGSEGTYGWGGFFYTTFFVDPGEELVAISMAQLHPSRGLDWNQRFKVLVYQAIDD